MPCNYDVNERCLLMQMHLQPDKKWKKASNIMEKCSAMKISIHLVYLSINPLHHPSCVTAHQLISKNLPFVSQSFTSTSICCSDSRRGTWKNHRGCHSMGKLLLFLLSCSKAQVRLGCICPFHPIRKWVKTLHFCWQTQRHTHTH